MVIEMALLEIVQKTNCSIFLFCFLVSMLADAHMCESTVAAANEWEEKEKHFHTNERDEYISSQINSLNVKRI